MERVQTSIPCIITDTHDAVVVCEQDRHGHPLRTVINIESGLVYTDPRPTHDETRKFYSEDYRQEYKGTAIPKKKHVFRAGGVALERWKKMESYFKKGMKVLDVGAGGGEMLYLLGKKGCKARGIEPNNGYANYAMEQYGVDIQVGFAEDADFNLNAFDAILLFHVLEHMEDPVQEIKRLKNLLKPGGTFIIEVPNVTCRNGFPSAKWHVGHLYNFNRTTLAATAVQAGMEIMRVEEPGDGGNLFGVFTNNEPAEPCSLKGNFDRVSHQLATHSVWRHLLSSHPYLRPIRKALRSISEKWTTRHARNGKEILDTLYQAPN